VPESSNSTRCVDYDECSEPGTCDQVCRNTPGSYECSCVSGYAKTKGSRCRAINGKGHRNLPDPDAQPANPSQFIVPPTEPATLTFLSQDGIRRIGTSGEVIAPTGAKDNDKVTDKDGDKDGEGNEEQLLLTQPVRFVHAFDVWHRNRTLCALHFSWYELQMRCQRIDDVRVNWTLPFSSFVSPQQCE